MKSKVRDLIDAERRRQQEKWGGSHLWGHGDCSSTGVSDSIKLAVLLEEVGEAARAFLDRDVEAMRDELVQVAAVAVAWLEAL